jgi:predicted CXXCH cytochrome family protein
VQIKKPGELCLQCHATTKKEIAEKKNIHEPFKAQQCGGCHLAHGSSQEKHLAKKKPDVCLTCHPEIAVHWQTGVVHSPAGKDCGLCHEAHGGNQTVLLKTAPEKLCATCHKGDDARYAKAHSGMTPSGKSCLSCHDPHGAPEKGLLYPVQHAPFKQGSCKACHPGRNN